VTHGEYSGLCLSPCRTRTADTVSHNGETPNLHRKASA
jgi:hypothetical protein